MEWINKIHRSTNLLLISTVIQLIKVLIILKMGRTLQLRMPNKPTLSWLILSRIQLTLILTLIHNLHKMYSSLLEPALSLLVLYLSRHLNSSNSNKRGRQIMLDTVKLNNSKSNKPLIIIHNHRIPTRLHLNWIPLLKHKGANRLLRVVHLKLKIYLGLKLHNRSMALKVHNQQLQIFNCNPI